MRLSRFEIKLLWFIGLTIFIALSFSIKAMYAPRGFLYQLLDSFGFMFKMMSVLSMFSWILGLNEDFKKIINVKYKIKRINEYSVKAEFLTFWFVIIPIWRPLTTEPNGIIGNFHVPKTYDTKKKALKAIEKHKEEVKKNRKEWFERPEKYKTTYYDK